MGAGVGLVRVLIRIEIAIRLFLNQAPHLADGAVRALHRIRIDDLGPVRGGDAFSGNADVCGHHEHHWETHRGADPAVRNAGVAARRINQRLLRGQSAVGESVENHLERGPVFDATSWVEILELGKDPNAGRARDPTNSHQRSSTYELNNVWGSARSGRRRRIGMDSAHPQWGQRLKAASSISPLLWIETAPRTSAAPRHSR